MQCSTRCDPSGNATMAFFTPAVSVPVTTALPAKKPAKEFGLAVSPDDAGVAGGEAVDTHERVRRTDHAGSRGRRADDACDGRDIHAGRRSVRGADAGDAAECAGGAVNTRAEE